MLPDRPDDQVLTVHRSLDVAEEDLVDAITAFAADEDLELDRRHEGMGLLFRGVGDFVLLGISALFGGRAMRYANAKDEEIDDLQVKIANALNAVCDLATRL